MAGSMSARSAACQGRAPGRALQLRHAPRTAQGACRGEPSAAAWEPRSVHTSAAAPERAAPAAAPVEFFQKAVELPGLPRGCHVVTRQLLAALPELRDFEVGLCNIFIQHTSASLTVNENASPDVPLDLADSLDRIAPERGVPYRHTDEGPDDMPAHVKSSLMGPSLTLPIQSGRLALGTWQGVYLNEHRNYGGPRRLVVTLQGSKRADGRRYSEHAA